MSNIVCFHNPDEENGYLSNWAIFYFTVDGITFSSAEQYMMYQKAICFYDSEIAHKILATDDVAEIKKLGRQVLNYNDDIWSEIRQDVVYKGLLAKFEQNEELKEQLKSTGEAILAECAVHDKIWGIGLSMTDPNRFDQNKWKGQNLLGYTLMKVRDNL